MLSRFGCHPAHGGGRVETLAVDLSIEAGIERLASQIAHTRATKYLCTLGLTCLPNWRETFSAVFEAAPSGSIFSIMDVYGKPLVRYLSDSSRPVWEELERRSYNYNKRDVVTYRPLGRAYTVFAAWGTKK